MFLLILVLVLLLLSLLLEQVPDSGEPPIQEAPRILPKRAGMPKGVCHLSRGSPERTAPCYLLGFIHWPRRTGGRCKSKISRAKRLYPHARRCRMRRSFSHKTVAPGAASTSRDDAPALLSVAVWGLSLPLAARKPNPVLTTTAVRRKQSAIASFDCI